MSKAQDTPTVAPQDGDGLPDSMVWKTLNTGLGKEWDFEKNPVLVARYIGFERLETSDPNSSDPNATRWSNAYQFSRDGLTDTDGTVIVDSEVYFIWGSATIDMALTAKDEPDAVRDDIRHGDVMRITYLGKESFKGGRTVKRFRVQIAAPKS